MRACALLLCLVSTARADDGAELAAAPLERAVARYDAADYRGAIVHFNEAYALTAAPALLFNIGQAYRLLGDPQRALFYYRRFLFLERRAHNRAEVEATIAELAGRSAPTPRPATPPRSATRPHPFAGRPLLLVGVIGAVASAVLVVGGGYFEVQARLAADRDGAKPDAGRSLAINGAALLSIGGAVAITSLILMAVGNRREARPRIALVPAIDGASFVLASNLP